MSFCARIPNGPEGGWCCMGRKSYWLQGMERRAIGIMFGFRN